MLEFYGSMINMDDPRHARLRGIVSRSFTPRVMQNLMDDVQQVAVDVLERIRRHGRRAISSPRCRSRFRSRSSAT